MRVIKKIHQFDFRKQDYFFLAKDFNLPMPKPIAKRTKYYLSLGFKFFDPIAYQNINF